jgi:replication-associated recombination protein RarA
VTQFQLDCAVADVIGEPVATVHRRGFSILVEDLGEPEPEEVRVVVICPHCIRAVPYAGLAGEGSLALAECLTCDVLFDVAPDAIFATAPVSG